MGGGALLTATGGKEALHWGFQPSNRAGQVNRKFTSEATTHTVKQALVRQLQHQHSSTAGHGSPLL